MRLTVLAALGAAAVAATAGVAVGQHYAPTSFEISNRTHLVLASVPTGPPVYVQPQCAPTFGPSFRPLPGTPADSGPAPQTQQAGRVPPGFAPVRAVKCDEDFASSTPLVTQSETSTDADLQKVLAALRPPRIEEPVGRDFACPAIGVVPLAIALVDAQGVAVRVDLPRGICGLYVDSATQLLRAAHWTVTQTIQAPLPS